MNKKIIEALTSYKFMVNSEKQTQKQMETVLTVAKMNFIREFRLSESDIIDFYFPDDKVGIEVKLQGTASRIYDQCKRYCESDQIKELILATRKTMGMPEEISGKKITVVSLGQGWL